MLTVEALKEYGANTEEALSRCFGNNDFYLKLVRMIADDTHLEQMAQAVAAHDLTAAFENAHALKGVLANLALTPVLTPVQELTELLRARTEMDYTSLLQEARVQMDRLLALIRE